MWVSLLARRKVSFYTFFFIVLVLMMKLGAMTDKILEHLVIFSMEMWLIHTWFCYYLFRGFFYGLHYPLLIYALLLAVTYASAVVVKSLVDRDLANSFVLYKLKFI